MARPSKRPLARRLFLVFSFSLVCVAFAAACVVSTEHPPAGDGYQPGFDPPGAVVREGGTESSTKPPVNDSGCREINQQSAVVTQMVYGGTAPAPAGGTVAEGTYVLTELQKYDINKAADAGPTSSTFQGRLTLNIDGQVQTILGARGTTLGKDTTSTSTCTTSGTTFMCTTVCPQPIVSFSFQYTAVGDQLTFYSSAVTLETYTKK